MIVEWKDKMEKLKLKVLFGQVFLSEDNKQIDDDNMKQVILDYIDFYTNSFKDEFIIEGEDQVIKIKIDVQAKEEYKTTNEITEKTTLYPNGKVYSKAEYNKKGLKHGVEKIYYKNGNLSSEEHWRNGRRCGLSIGYYENGNLESVEIKENGKTKFLKYYDENGNYEIIK